MTSERKIMVELVQYRKLAHTTPRNVGKFHFWESHYRHNECVPLYKVYM